MFIYLNDNSKKEHVYETVFNDTRAVTRTVWIQ